MKTRTKLFSTICLVIALIVIVSLIGCGNRKNAPEPGPTIVVLKFNQAEYKDYILANHSNDEDSIVAMRFNRCGEPIGHSGYSPYWELENNWLLVDWKWFKFPYDAGLVLLTNQTWDKYPSETFPLPKLPASEPYLSQPTERIMYIPAESLSQYTGNSYSEEMLALIRGTFHGCEDSNWADSCWTVLQEDLSVAIKNGYLEKLDRSN